MTNIQLHNFNPAYEMTFSNVEGVVAKLKWQNGVLSHEGKIDESVELFLDLINQKSVTQYNEMKNKIHQLELELMTAKAQNDLYKKALENR